MVCECISGDISGGMQMKEIFLELNLINGVLNGKIWAKIQPCVVNMRMYLSG